MLASFIYQEPQGIFRVGVTLCAGRSNREAVLRVVRLVSRRCLPNSKWCRKGNCDAREMCDEKKKAHEGRVKVAEIARLRRRFCNRAGYMGLATERNLG